MRHLPPIACVLLLVACHDADRENPFDPELTPPVEEVTVSVDPAVGAAVVEWDPYTGSQPFAEYRVLRKEVLLERVDILAVIADQSITTYVDTTIRPDLDYEFFVEVINEAGYQAASERRSARSFTVGAVDLLSAPASSRDGTIALQWQRYDGPGFAGYQVWRKTLGQDDGILLQSVADVSATSWTDTTPLPDTVYEFWIAMSLYGGDFASRTLEAIYDLPAVTIESASFSSDTAAAELTWSEYEGPRFEAYEVWRRVEGELALNVKEISDRSVTTHTDSVLDGNTEYFYHVEVRTTWPDVSVSGPERGGIFYRLEREIVLPALSNNQVQAIGIAIDENDELYAGITAISTTSAADMDEGIQVRFPQAGRYRRFFSDIVPHFGSPIHLAVSGGRVFAAVRTEADSLVLVGAIGVDETAEWSEVVDTGGALPAGLFMDIDGLLTMVDEEGIMYRFSSDGEAQGRSEILRGSGLLNEQAIPIRHIIRAPGAGLQDLDLFLLAVPGRGDTHVIGKTRVTERTYGGREKWDDGVGSDNGQTLNPVALAFDASRTRLMVMELRDRGMLQVLNAKPSVKPRYITKWGVFGSEPGEFLVTPPTAVSMAVDSEGRVFVADGRGEGGRIQVFAP